MNNGPWGTGNHGYTSWNSRTGAVTYGGTPQNGPKIIGIKNGVMLYDRPVQQAAPQSQQQEAPIDWTKLLSGGDGSSNAAPAINITSGIQAGPVYNQQQTANATARYNAMRPQGQGATTNALYSQYADQARLGTSRNISAGNASQLLNSESARSGAGLRWAGMGANNSDAVSAHRQRLNQQALTLLRVLGVM